MLIRKILKVKPFCSRDLAASLLIEVGLATPILSFLQHNTSFNTFSILFDKAFLTSNRHKLYKTFSRHENSNHALFTQLQSPIQQCTIQQCSKYREPCSVPRDQWYEYCPSHDRLRCTKVEEGRKYVHITKRISWLLLLLIDGFIPQRTVYIQRDLNHSFDVHLNSSTKYTAQRLAITRNTVEMSLKSYIESPSDAGQYLVSFDDLLASLPMASVLSGQHKEELIKLRWCLDSLKDAPRWRDIFWTFHRTRQAGIKARLVVIDKNTGTHIMLHIIDRRCVLMIYFFVQSIELLN